MFVIYNHLHCWSSIGLALLLCLALLRAKIRHRKPVMYIAFTNDINLFPNSSCEELMWGCLFSVLQIDASSKDKYLIAF